MRRVILGMNSVEIKILKILKRHSTTAQKISSALGKNISTVNRYLNDLISKGFVYKVSKCCTPQRGRYFVYHLNDKKTILDNLDRRIDNFRNDAHEFVEKLFE